MANQNQDIVRRYKRDFAPAHYMFKIESLAVEVERYQSGIFEAGGYKWSLVFYPSGYKGVNEKNHVSIYLGIEGIDKFAPNWQVFVSFRLFIFDQLRDKYLTLEANDGAIKRFDVNKPFWGLIQALPLESFNNASNGYCIRGTCILGAEVFVVTNKVKQDEITMLKTPSDNIFTWTTNNFSNLDSKLVYSQLFTVAGGSKWKIGVKLSGSGSDKDRHLSVHWYFDESNDDYDRIKYYVDFIIGIRSQTGGSRALDRPVTHWFSKEDYCWGFKRLITLDDLKEKHLIANNCLTVEVEINAITKYKSVS